MVNTEIRVLLEQHAIPIQELNGIGLSFPGIVNNRVSKVLSKFVKYKMLAVLTSRNGQNGSGVCLLP